MTTESIPHFRSNILISYFYQSNTLRTTSIVNFAKDMTNTDRVYPFKKSKVLVCSTI
jgi:hypothetical protein